MLYVLGLFRNAKSVYFSDFHIVVMQTIFNDVSKIENLYPVYHKRLEWSWHHQEILSTVRRFGFNSVYIHVNMSYKNWQFDWIISYSGISKSKNIEKEWEFCLSVKVDGNNSMHATKSCRRYVHQIMTKYKHNKPRNKFMGITDIIHNQHKL